jgi:O-antigen/teichoic acid export membrane protein
MAGGYALLATLVLAVLGKPLISLVYTKDFLPAYPALIILLLGYLVADIFYWRRIALLSFGRPDFPVKLNFILSLLKIAASIILIPRYGFLASASLLSAFYWLGSLFSWRKIRQLLREGEQAG